MVLLAGLLGAGAGVDGISVPPPEYPLLLNFEDLVVLLTIIVLSPRLGVQDGFARGSA